MRALTHETTGRAAHQRDRNLDQDSGHSLLHRRLRVAVCHLFVSSVGGRLLRYHILVKKALNC